jgi:3-phenylpropionate/cinnamic acid dioxygenase small subunit
MPLTVEDQLAIQQLYANYNHAIDAGKGDAWADTFTADATFNSAAGNFSGREQLAGFANGFAQRIKARHWINNLVIEGDDGKAKGSCYLVLFRLTPGEQPPAGILTTAIYNDELAKGPDLAWRFTKRSVVGDA